MQQCPRSFYLLLKKDTPAGTIIKGFKTSCKTWSCPVCAPKKRNALYHKVKDYFKNRQLFMITLTVRVRGQSIDTQSKHLKLSFSKFRKRINRKYGKFPYIYFVEIGKGNNLHYHLLTDKYLTPAWLVKNWRECTKDSWIIDIKGYGIKHSIIYKYVQKYVVKQAVAHGSSLIGGYRIYSYSSDFWNPIKIKAGWKLLKYFLSLRELIDAYWTAVDTVREEFFFEDAQPPNTYFQNSDLGQILITHL